MKSSSRIGVCSNCGHLLFRSVVTRNSKARAESHRSISWKSLFSIPSGLSKPSASSTNSTPSDDEKQRKARETVQRLREARDQTRRPIVDTSNVPQGQLNTKSSVSRQTPAQQTSGERLRDMLKERLLPLDKTSKQTLLATTKHPQVGLDRQLRSATKRINSAFSSESAKNPFLSPLRTEQREALRKYLEMSSSKKEVRAKVPRFPWQEPPLPSEMATDIRDILASTPSKPELQLDSTRQVVGDTPDAHVVEAANVDERLYTSKLYEQLRDHHKKSQEAFTDRNTVLLKSVNRQLTDRIESTFQQLEKRFKDAERIQIFNSFQKLLRPSMPNISAQYLITPLIRYLLADQGFLCTTGYDVTRYKLRSTDLCHGMTQSIT